MFEKFGLLLNIKMENPWSVPLTHPPLFWGISGSVTSNPSQWSLLASICNWQNYLSLNKTRISDT